MVYVVYNADGTIDNTIEINEENVAEYEALTGFTLRVPEPSTDDVVTRPSYAEMEMALNELGVKTRE